MFSIMLAVGLGSIIGYGIGYLRGASVKYSADGWDSNPVCVGIYYDVVGYGKLYVSRIIDNPRASCYDLIDFHTFDDNKMTACKLESFKKLRRKLSSKEEFNQAKKNLRLKQRLEEDIEKMMVKELAGNIPPKPANSPKKVYKVI